MPIRGPHIGPALRLRIGASVLSTAELVDTHLVERRLVRFRHLHARYVAAHRKVTTVAAELRDARARLAACDARQDEAVEALARALAVDGRSRLRPFAAFGMPSPSAVARLPYADEAKTVHRLVAAIRRRAPEKRTLRAARVADDAARAVERGIARVAEIESRAHAARLARDALRHVWHSAYTALKRGAQAAADDGAPHLHAMLFPRASRAGKRRATAAAQKRASASPQH